MKVREVVKELLKYPMDATIVVASDAEQSDFNVLGSIQVGYWDQHDGYGEFHEEAEIGDPDLGWEPQEISVHAICLTPEG